MVTNMANGVHSRILEDDEEAAECPFDEPGESVVAKPSFSAIASHGASNAPSSHPQSKPPAPSSNATSTEQSKPISNGQPAQQDAKKATQEKKATKQEKARSAPPPDSTARQLSTSLPSTTSLPPANARSAKTQDDWVEVGKKKKQKTKGDKKPSLKKDKGKGKGMPDDLDFQFDEELSPKPGGEAGEDEEYEEGTSMPPVGRRNQFSKNAW